MDESADHFKYDMSLRNCIFGVLALAFVGIANAESARVIGTLGQSVKQTKIYRTMSRNGRVLTPVSAFRYLVINTTKDADWLAVIMTDGTTGYIQSEQVAQLPYQVTAGTPHADGSPTVASVSSGSSPSRGSTGRLPTVRAGTGASLPPAPQTDVPQSGRSQDLAQTAKARAIEESFHYIGTPYQWGGENLTGGIDCSAFVQKLYGHEGIALPRTAREQAEVGMQVERLEQLQAGDRLYFWSSKKGAIGHTGIFLGFFQDGGAYFIHSSSSNHGVATDDLRNPKWRRILVEARR